MNELTQRERQILALIAVGCSNREIGDRLGLLEGTIRSYTARIFGKLNVKNRTAAIYAMGWIDVPADWLDIP